MPQPYTNLKSGNGSITTAGTAVQLAAGATPCAELTITANENNVGTIVYGGSNVVGAASGRIGTPLVPFQSVQIRIDDLSKVWFDAVTSGDGYSYSYLF
jgi:hypothetical protein